MPNPTAIVPVVSPAPDFRTATWRQLADGLRALDTKPYVAVNDPFTLTNLGLPAAKSIVMAPFSLAQDSIIDFCMVVGAAQTGNTDEYACLWAIDPQTGITFRQKVLQGTTGKGSVALSAGDQCFLFGVGWSGQGHRIIAATNPGSPYARLQTAAAHGLSDGEAILISGTGNPDHHFYDGQFNIVADDATHFKILADGSQGTATGYWRRADGAAKLQFQFGCAVRAAPSGGPNVEPPLVLPNNPTCSPLPPVSPVPLAIRLLTWPGTDRPANDPIFAIYAADGSIIAVAGGGAFAVDPYKLLL